MATPMSVSQEQFEELAQGLDKAWLIICGGVIFSMQCGFALLEAGAIRKKNSHIVWHKLMLNSLICSFAWWLIGYAIAFGDNEGGFLGGQRFWAGDKYSHPHADLSTQSAHWVFQVSIACVVVAITGGSISERATLKATAIHTFIMTGFIYPVAVSWTWGGGWLSKHFHYRDFTGSGIVHCTGAFAGLAGLLVIGPRYNKNGKFNSVFKDTEKKEEVHTITTNEELYNFRRRVVEDEFETFGITNASYTIFGAMILWFQFIFFNAGSSLFVSEHDAWLSAEKGALNTFMGGCGAGIVGMVLKHWLVNGFNAPRKWRDDAATCANAFLGGMVANGAGMDTYEPWESLVIGIIAAVFYCLACLAFEKLHLDDALEAWQLHGVCGSVGVGCAAFFNHVDGIFHSNPTGGEVLGRQLLGWLCISAWSFMLSLIIWLACKYANILRVDLKTEIVGYDFIDYASTYNVQLPVWKLESGKGESSYAELTRKSTD